MRGTLQKFQLALAAVALAIPVSDVLAQSRQSGPPTNGQGGAQQQQAQQQQRQAERSMNQQQTLDHGRLQERERDRTQAPASKTAAKSGGSAVYGGNLMTKEERDRYREQLRLLDTDQQRSQFEARHREQMQARARQRGVEPEVTED